MEELENVLIMEDGASYHEAMATTRRREYEKDGWIDWGLGIWSAESPDLNLIENLWHILRTNVRKRVPQPMRKQDLITELMQEWEKPDINMVNRLIESMLTRLQAVIDADGGAINISIIDRLY